MIGESELILNEDGSIFHLHLRPEQVAGKVILVGDQGRVDTVAKYLTKIETEAKNREFHSVTGWYGQKRITIVSTGIGCDNIDIVINELDALINIDFTTRQVKPKTVGIDIVRIGTCGGLQLTTPVGTFVASVKSIGFDGLLNFYEGRNETCDLELEQAFREHMDWNPLNAAPYVAVADKELVERIAGDDMVRGITIACGGFYGPQGRVLRLPLADPDQNERVESFQYEGMRITNFEMESSALAGLARLLGHKAMTCCMVIANRRTQDANTQYKNSIDSLIKLVLDRI